jgi:alkaline phosphatase D
LRLCYIKHFTFNHQKRSHIMIKTTNRRDFIRLIVIGSTAAGVSIPLINCSEDDPPKNSNGETVDMSLSTTLDSDMQVQDMMTTPALDPSQVYPQGLASGDPTPSSVILWTRVEPQNDTEVMVTYEVSTESDFSMLVASGEIMTTTEDDNIVRLKITDLTPYTVYYYRFQALNTISITGRTKTAPSEDQDVNVRFGIASCQDYNGRYYHAWKVLADEPDVDFVVFLGDYIYETTSDPRFQEQQGRRITLPDGLALNTEGESKAALTLADYRSLYRQYRSDPNLQAIHAKAAFVVIWDDHEFADDSWQDHSTHFNEEQGSEQNTARRTAVGTTRIERL